MIQYEMISNEKLNLPDALRAMADGQVLCRTTPLNGSKDNLHKVKLFVKINETGFIEFNHKQQTWNNKNFFFIPDSEWFKTREITIDPIVEPTLTTQDSMALQITQMTLVIKALVDKVNILENGKSNIPHTITPINAPAIQIANSLPEIEADKRYTAEEAYFLLFNRSAPSSYAAKFALKQLHQKRSLKLMQQTECEVRGNAILEYLRLNKKANTNR